MKTFLDGLAKLMFGMAGLAFLMGGGLIHVVVGTTRILAEMEGLGLAVVLGGLGAWAKSAAENILVGREGGDLDSEELHHK